MSLSILLMLLLALLSEVHRVGIRVISQRINNTQTIVIPLRREFFIISRMIANILIINIYSWISALLNPKRINKAIRHAENRKVNLIKHSIRELKITEQKVFKSIFRKIKKIKLNTQ